MTGESQDWLNALGRTPYGPTNLIAKNCALTVAGLAGVTLLVVPALQAAPIASILLAGIAGIGLLAAVSISVLRWRWLLARASRSAQENGARYWFGFMQIDRRGSNAHLDFGYGAGWLQVLDSQLVITLDRSWNLGGDVISRSILSPKIASVAQTEPTTIAFANLIVETTDGVQISFTPIPRSGSGLRGPSESEVAQIATELRAQICGD